MEDRLKLNDTFQESVIKLAEGNPGAIRVCMELFVKNAICLLLLDSRRIYGNKIWELYKDKNNCDIDKVIKYLKEGSD